MTVHDLELLDEYARKQSESAFTALVARHLNLVYSAALRQVRSTQLAEEVSQSVFLDLARSARKLKPDTILTAWLYQVTRRTAIDVVRRESRRQARERLAAEMAPMNTTAGWTHIEPVLDEAMDALDETDRAAILLRYFENKSLREVGATLGTSDDAAQKRVSRAVERLREFLAKRGITVGAGGLVVLVTANAVQAAPASLTVAIPAAVVAIAKTTFTTTTTATATKAIAMTTLQKTLITAIVVAGAAIPFVVQHQAQSKLRDENEALRQQITQLQADNDNFSRRLARDKSSLVLKLPAPALRSAAPSSGPPAEDLTATNLYARLTNNSAKLTVGQLAPYLNANHRSASSLLAAYRTTGDPALLEEAKQKYPDDPQVAFEAAFQKDAAPEERRQWLDAFKKSAPDNSLANYLSALDYFKAGRTDQAVQDLIAASGKPQFQDYTLDRYQDDEEAYLAAGYSVAEAKTIPAWQLLLPQLQQIKDVSLDLVDLANSYRQAGDQVSAQTALQMAADLGARYGSTGLGETEISHLVGVWVERNALTAMDPSSPYGQGGQTVQDRINYLTQERAQLDQIGRQVDALLPLMSDQDWISYRDRWTASGEIAAAKWLINKYGQK